MNHQCQTNRIRLAVAACVLLTLEIHAGNPLWNGAGTVTNNNFSNTNNWVAGNVPPGNSINGLSVNFGLLAGGATNTANCDATGNSGVWTFNSGAAAMVVTLNSTNQLGAVTGPDVFINNSTNLQTITGAFRLFDINVSTNSRRFTAAAGPLAITASVLTLRGDSSPTNWAIELGGSATGSILNCGFANGGSLGGKTVNLLKTGTGSWEIMSALPNLTTNATSVTVQAGMLTLDGANSYSGTTVVSNGATLNTVTAATGGGAYAVSNAATLGVTISAAGSSLTNASLTLGTAGADATTLNVNLGGFGSLAQPVIIVTGALTVNGTNFINLSGGSLPTGQFPVIRYGSQTGAAGLGLGGLPTGMIASLSNNVANSSIDLVVTGDTNLLYWNGNLSAMWDISTTANWKVGGLGGQFYQEGDSIVFDDTAAGNYAVTLNSILHPQIITVSNNVNSYTLSGPGGIGWTAGMLKSGNNVVTLTVANSFFAGPVTVGAGALVLSNLTAVAGPGGLVIADGAVVQPRLAGTYASVVTTLNGSSTANGSFGGSLDFHVGGTEIWPGQIILNDPSATIGSFGGTCNVTLSGQLTGSGSLTIRPEGGSAASHTATFTLSSPNNNYAGSTTMQVGTAEMSATLKAGVNNALPVTTALNLDRAGSSGVVYFDLAGFSQTVAGLRADFGSNAVINSTGTGTLTVSNTTDTVFSGTIGISGKAAINLVKQGNAALTLNGTNAYTGSTTIGGGTLSVNGLITATSGLQMSNNATLQLALGLLGGPTNIVVIGNVTLAGQIGVSDFGIVSNTRYPVIYYTGKLTNNGITIAPGGPCVFTINTNTPHIVYLDVTQKFPPAEFTSTSSAVSTLTTNLSGILHGTPGGPIWYEVRDQTNKMWDFGATRAVSPWSITVRHLRAGTNTVTIFAQDGLGNIQSNGIQLTLTLGAYPAVRPRPIPSEIWWGGYADNTQLTNYSQWPFVQKYQDGYLFHIAPWLWHGDTSWLVQSLVQNLQPFNPKFMPELAGSIGNVSTNSAAAELSSAAGQAAFFESNGAILSEFTHDYHMEDMKGVCQVNPTWNTNDDIAWWTGDLSIASTNYPYTNPPSGIWRDVFNGYYQMFPHIKVGHTSQPEYWPWDSYPSPYANGLSFTVTNPTTTFSFNAHDIIGSFVNMAGAIGHPYFSLQSDAPWNYFHDGAGGSLAKSATMRQKIRVYEQYLQSRDCRHTLICNKEGVSTNQTLAADLDYETNSLNSMWLHQQEGGRANRYLFESWYRNIPFTVVPETQAGSYTHLALTAIKYLKGIADTNGTLEQLNLTPTATNGTVVQLQLQNNGDVQCLPALAGQPGTVPGVNTRYFTTNGLELTATVLTAEGFCFTNLLQPAAKTNLIAVTLASGLTVATNDNDSLEAFWNPQDPLGIVRDREIFSPVVNPLGLWQDADIGSVGVTGGSALSGTNFTLLGSGADIGGTADAFHFVYQTNSGDGAFIVRVSSQLAADPSSKAGLMIRESSATSARYVFVGITPGNSVSFQNRAATNGVSSSTAVAGFTAPCWVQLVRSGTAFTASYSTNGVNWMTLGSSNITGFATAALWGLAVTAHNNALASAATFDNVTPPNAGPVLNPMADRTLIAGQTLTLTNTATDPNSPPQILTFSLLAAPIGMMLNPTNGILIWRPAMAQAPSTNLVAVQVADNGAPVLSATNSFWVTVNSPVRPGLSAGIYSNGIFTVTVSGDTGPDYVLQTSTNLSLWLSVMTNYSPSLPFNWNVPQTTNPPADFFRVKLQP